MAEFEGTAPGDFAYAEISGSCMEMSKNAINTTVWIAQIGNWPERSSCK